jgi:hypothetical protein
VRRRQRAHLTTGSGKSVASTVGAPGDTFVVQTDPTTYGVVDGAGPRRGMTKGTIVVAGANGIQVLKDKIDKPSVPGILSWRRIHNYQDLKNAKP